MSKLSIAVSGSDHVEGDSSALCTVVEYGDYQCPACGEAYPIVKRLQKTFGSSMRLVFRNFPLAELHPYAEHAAEAAEFSAAGGKFWEMHDLLFVHQEDLQDDVLLVLADRLKLPRVGLQRALAASSYSTRIKADISGGVRSGVNGTPTFFINGLRHDGAFDFETLSEAIQSQMPTMRADQGIHHEHPIRR
jgi:protein-disulfide isomerase